MTRTQFRATIRIDGVVVDADTAYAFNSAIRRTEALARTYARRHGVVLHGGPSSSTGEKYARTNYRREWSNGTVVAIVEGERIEPVSASYVGHWDEQQGYPVVDWKAAVTNDETRLGYHDWAEQQSEMGE